ncbi:hypothetical protein AC249_AIPGENE8707 [Exaiptasia diaphana]|nr:hypothetical protein AC249_AIPGENE8707 [Exaiptasia diaphana]
MENEFKTWLQNKKQNTQNQREFAKSHLGYTGRKNATGIDLVNFYPGTMHKTLRATETIVRRIGVIAEQLNLKEKWFKEIKRVARKVTETWDVKFDQVGAIAFYKQSPELLANTGFTGITLEVLTEFCSQLYPFFQTVLFTPLETTRTSYDIAARVLLGFNFVIIFGNQSVTATVKHLVAYMGFYIDKALNDGIQVGVPLSLRNFSDGIMETKHKEGKQLTLLDKSNARKSSTNLLTLLSKNRLLQRALEMGLQSSYDGKYFHVEPHENYPLLRDPTLVLAAQQAVKTFTECSDVQTAISLYKGLYNHFKALLMKRMQNNRKEE